MGLGDWWKAVGYRFAQSKRTWLVTILFVAAFVGGAALAFFASTPVVESAGTEVLMGSAPNGTSSDPLTLPSVAITDATLEVGDCGLNLHFLTQFELRAFNESGVLPAPTLTCDVRNARLSLGIVVLILENERGAPSDYRVMLTFFRVESPFALAALPALFLVLVGSVGIIVQVLRRGLTRTLDTIIEK